MTPALTVKSRVTIPKPIRDYLGVVPGKRNKLETLPHGRVVISAAKETAKKPINPFAKYKGIIAELSATHGAADMVEALMQDAGRSMESFSESVARWAGQALAKYRKRNGAKTGVPVDFFIGAQAQSGGWTLRTRDKARYKTYFPTVALITPL